MKIYISSLNMYILYLHMYINMLYIYNIYFLKFILERAHMSWGEGVEEREK